MTEETHSRRAIVRLSAAALAVGFSGCSGLESLGIVGPRVRSLRLSALESPAKR